MDVKLSPVKMSSSPSLESKDTPEMSIITMTHYNKMDKIREYLNQNPTFNLLSVRDPRYYTLLHIACLNNHMGICEYLFKHITNLNTSNEIIKKWVNSRTDEGFTALHFASFKGNIELVKLLELHGADINAVNFQGLTMIHLASQGDQPVSIAYFQSKSLSIHVKDKKGSTPLHWAAFLGMENSTNYLTSWGSEPNSVDNDSGLTPLHLAVISGNPRVVRRLLTRGANKSLRTKEGKMAIDFAKDNDDQRITYLLGNPNWFLRYLNIKPGLERRRSRSSLILFLFLFFATVFANVLFIFPFIQNPAWVVLFGVSVSLTFVFFLFAWLTNPGYMKNMQKEDILPLLLTNDPHLVCPDCVILKPQRSRHCDFCKACISVQDHHCPWINNCVGSRNHAYFVWFTLFTLLGMLVIVFMTVFHLGAFDADYFYFPFFKFASYELLFCTKNVVCGANLVSAIVFLVPLLALNYVQLGNIFSGKTTSERYGTAPSQENLNQTMNQSATSSMEDTYIRYREEERSIRQWIKNCQLMCCLNKNDSRYNYRPMPLSKLNSHNLDTELSF